MVGKGKWADASLWALEFSSPNARQARLDELEGVEPESDHMAMS